MFDLDPGEGVAWKDIVAAAREIRQRLEGVKLKSFAKLTGGKGIHVMLPIDGTDWDTAKDFSQAVVMSLVADAPQRYVGKMTKSLRKGKIFIDYFRNSREATSVAAYSTSAAPSPRRRGLGAAVVGTTRPRQKRRRLHCAQPEKAVRAKTRGPVSPRCDKNFPTQGRGTAEFGRQSPAIECKMPAEAGSRSFRQRLPLSLFCRNLVVTNTPTGAASNAACKGVPSIS